MTPLCIAPFGMERTSVGSTASSAWSWEKVRSFFGSTVRKEDRAGALARYGLEELAPIVGSEGARSGTIGPTERRGDRDRDALELAAVPTAGWRRRSLRLE